MNGGLDVILFRVADDKVFCVIEPGNIRQLKAGHPVKVELPNGSLVALAFTPDGKEFLRGLGVNRSEALWQRARVSFEELENGLKRCRNMPEVER
jgi:hypothetical protein